MIHRTLDKTNKRLTSTVSRLFVYLGKYALAILSALAKCI
jgi:hypothetical protein